MPDQSNEHYSGLDQCWEWLGCHDSDGYGSFYANGFSMKAHRVACAVVNGIGEGEVICHKCDNRGCVNPLHMIRGTTALNNKDASIKGRAAFGDRNGTRTHPETRPRGDGHPLRINPSLAASGARHGSKTHPERVPSGDRHGSATKPWMVPRGERHGSVTKPESRPRGENHFSKTNPEKLARGERSGSAKLKTSDVIEIRRMGRSKEKTRAEMAAMFGVSIESIKGIIRYKSWKHVV